MIHKVFTQQRHAPKKSVFTMYDFESYFTNVEYKSPQPLSYYLLLHHTCWLENQNMAKTIACTALLHFLKTRTAELMFVSRPRFDGTETAVPSCYERERNAIPTCSCDVGKRHAEHDA